MMENVKAQDREDARRAVGLAMWSYVGLIIPLIGWILAGYAYSLTKGLSVDDPIVAKRIASARHHARASVWLSIIWSVIGGIIILSLLSSTADADRHEFSSCIRYADQQYQEALDKAVSSEMITDAGNNYNVARDGCFGQ